MVGAVAAVVGHDPRMTAQELADRAGASGLRLVRFLWCGNDGTIRAKASARNGLAGQSH